VFGRALTGWNRSRGGWGAIPPGKRIEMAGMRAGRKKGTIFEQVHRSGHWVFNKHKRRTKGGREKEVDRNG